MAEEKEEQRIFLDDWTIRRWEPKIEPFGIDHDRDCGTYTIVKDFIGKDTLDTRVGPYQITASAAKYLADVMRIPVGEHPILPGSKIPNRREEVMFEGGIIIYYEGKIGATEINGPELITMGPIWYAEKPRQARLPLVLNQEHTLKGIIFGHENNERGRKERIDAIIRGYAQQEQEERDGISHRLFDEYKRGRLDTIESGGRPSPWEL